MLVKDICKECNLTKKAVEYYIEQKLIQPEILGNGYRNFSISDVERLKKTAVLRHLGISIQNIKEVLNDDSQTALYKISERKRLEIEAEKSKLDFLQHLAETHDWELCRSQLEALENKQTILERLLNVFPGYYGKYISLHFALYLNEAIVSDEQQAAFETIIDFLDNVTFAIPPDLQEYLDKVSKIFNETLIENIALNMNNAIQNTEKYIKDNREVIEQYMQLKQSDAYKNSQAYRLQEFLKRLNSENGYDTIFIPAMKKLSKSYCEYHNALEKANDAFLQQYPYAVH